MSNAPLASPKGGGGGVLGKIFVGVCRWDSETLNLYQVVFATLF